VDFRNTDLRGYDFTGARMCHCLFDGARIEGARFDQAEINGTNLRAAKDWDKHRRRWRRPKNVNTDAHLPDFALFQDAPFAPEMIVIPPGKFWMGSPDGGGTQKKEAGRSENEGPLHQVTISKSFAVSRFPITFDEWDFSGNRSLGANTGRPYRLLSEAEWEYVARAGTNTPFSWGSSITPKLANYDGRETYSGGQPGEYRRRTVPVATFKPNRWGLYQVHGNVSEWCEDCWHNDYKGAPTDGSAWTDGKGLVRVARGGSWLDEPTNLRSASRTKCNYSYHALYGVSFRVARVLNL
jgi:formylglycine-generating enzyme required for sulfatase activity